MTQLFCRSLGLISRALSRILVSKFQTQSRNSRVGSQKTHKIMTSEANEVNHLPLNQFDNHNPVLYFLSNGADILKLKWNSNNRENWNWLSHSLSHWEWLSLWLWDWVSREWEWIKSRVRIAADLPSRYRTVEWLTLSHSITRSLITLSQSPCKL